jgi:YD repeat-containing protein
VIESQTGNLAPVFFTYDSHGRLTTATEGTGVEARSYTFTWDPENRLTGITDPLNHTVGFAYDAADRVTIQTLPDGREVRYSYDGNGNVSSITPPGRPAHGFSYTPVDLEEQYTPPDVGAGANVTQYVYNTERQLTQVIRPDGNTVDLEYDSAGRLRTVTHPHDQVNLTYDAVTGQLTSVSTADGGTLTYTYDGSLVQSKTWAGVVSGTVSYTYDNDFRLASESVNGGHTVTYTYDTDGLLIQAGDLVIERDPQTGLITGTTLGVVRDIWSYNAFGEPVSYQVTVNDTEIFRIEYQRDALGRIVQKTETIEGVTHVFTYGYDAEGRLTDVTQDGILTAHYEYDANGNRLSVTTPSGGAFMGWGRFPTGTVTRSVHCPRRVSSAIGD